MKLHQILSIVEAEDARPATLDALRAYASRLKVEIDVWEDHERIDLHWIARKGGKPGSGAKVVAALCDYADRTHKFILLQTENENLSAYYSDWGFDDLDADDLEDHYPDWDEILVRHPR